jgi:hypothetical protein
MNRKAEEIYGVSPNELSDAQMEELHRHAGQHFAHQPEGQITICHSTYGTIDTNVRRILASVRACQDVPIDALEAGAVQQLIHAARQVDAADTDKHLAAAFQFLHLVLERITAFDLHHELTKLCPEHNPNHHIFFTPNIKSYGTEHPTRHITCQDCPGDVYLANVPLERS